MDKGPPLSPEIVMHYRDEIDEGQRMAAGLPQLELLRTQEIVRRHLPPRSLRILDVGGATGIHASWLVADGHRVHLIDPIFDQVERALALPAAHVGSLTAEVGDARQLRQNDASFDAALLLGPLYHLPDRSDRLRALDEARRVVRPGGLVFVAAISRFASLFDGLATGGLFEPAFRAIVTQDLVDGQHRNPERRPHWFTTAFFHHPDELRDELETADLAVREIVGVEGLAAWIRSLDERWADPGARELIAESARLIEHEPCLLGLSPHLLAVTEVPNA